MKKFQRNITVIICYLKKIHKYALIKQLELYKIMGNKDEYKIDSRITSFGLIRTIVFCAINDAYNLHQNISEDKYIKVKMETNEPSDKAFLKLALENYPIYNYIIRYQSIIETCTKSFLTNSQHLKFSNTLEESKLTAYKIIKAWRNTIHHNGFLEKEELYIYRGRKIIIPAERSFEFDFWTLYRISMDLIDLLFDFCIKSFQENPGIQPYLIENKNGL